MHTGRQTGRQIDTDTGGHTQIQTHRPRQPHKDTHTDTDRYTNTCHSPEHTHPLQGHTDSGIMAICVAKGVNTLYHHTMLKREITEKMDFLACVCICVSECDVCAHVHMGSLACVPFL